MAASSKGSRKSGKKPRGKRDFSLDLDIPMIGKAKFNSKKGTPTRREVSAPIAKGLISRSVGPKVSVSGSSERIVGSGCLLTLPDDTSNEGGDMGLSVPLNPGLKQFFPWLSATAGLFSRYRFNRLNFKFVPRVSTITVGDLILMGDPNVQNSLPHTFTDAIAYEGSVYGNIWASSTFDGSCFCGIDKYVRLSNLSPGEDSKTYDSGIFGYLTAGYQPLTASASPGYITVDYDVTFFDRRLPPNPGCFVTVQNVWWGGDNISPIGILWESPNPGSIVISHENADGDYFIGFPQGLWLISFFYCPRDGFVVPTGTNCGYVLLTGSGPQSVVLLDVAGLDLILDGYPMELGSGGRMRSGSNADPIGSSGQASALWAFEATGDAVPPLGELDPLKLPPGWVHVLRGGNPATSGVPVMTTNIICRMSPEYASYLGFGDGVPVVTPRIRSEVRRLGRFGRVRRTTHQPSARVVCAGK